MARKEKKFPKHSFPGGVLCSVCDRVVRNVHAKTWTDAKAGKGVCVECVEKPGISASKKKRAEVKKPEVAVSHISTEPVDSGEEKEKEEQEEQEEQEGKE